MRLSREEIISILTEDANENKGLRFTQCRILYLCPHCIHVCANTCTMVFKQKKGKKNQIYRYAERQPEDEQLSQGDWQGGQEAYSAQEYTWGRKLDTKARVIDIRPHPSAPPKQEVIIGNENQWKQVSGFISTYSSGSCFWSCLGHQR